MQKLKDIKKKFVAKKVDRELNEDGFSLLELVVAIGILLVLTVGGLIGYSKITDNARTAAVESAASSVMTAALVFDSNGDNPQKAATDYNNSSADNSINVVVTPAGTEDGQNCFTVTATRTASGHSAERSNCSSGE